MQYISLEDGIDRLPLTVRSFNALRRNGVHTVQELLLSMEEGKLENFAYLGKKGVEEIRRMAGDLYTGVNGFLIMLDEDEISRLRAESAAKAQARAPSEADGNTRVTDLPLSTRAVNALMRGGISTADQLRAVSEEQLLRLPNLGPKTLQEILAYRDGRLPKAPGPSAEAAGEAPRQPAAVEEDREAHAADRETAGELGAFLRLQPAICRMYILEARKGDPEARGENFIRRLYAAAPVRRALLSRLLSIVDARGDEGIAMDILTEELPGHLRGTNIAGEALRELELQGEIRIEGGICARRYPSIMDHVNALEDTKTRRIVTERLNGRTLKEIGDDLGITRERVRQICARALKVAHRGGGRYREDRYLLLYTRYVITREEFTLAFDEPYSTYEYLSNVFDGDLQSRKPLEAVLGDEEIPPRMRRQLERPIYRDYVAVDGQRVHRDRQSLTDHYIRTRCRELTAYNDFEQGYHGFLEELGLTGEDLRIHGRGYENRLSTHMSVLWSQWRRFRYYDIRSREYGEFLESLDLMQYDGMEISSLKLFRDDPALMEEYDIRDEYELHNLLKKIWDKRDGSVSFGRMPTIAIGEVDRDAQVRSLLLQHSPVTAERFSVLYEEAYGVKAATVLGTYMRDLDVYFFDGIYSIDAGDLPEDQHQRLREVLSGDYYAIRDVERIYLREFPGADPSRIDPYTLKTLGFRVYSSYVVRGTYASAVDYFNFLLTSRDVVDMRDHPAGIQNIVAFKSEMYRLRQEREIVEFGPYKFIHIRRLAQYGVTRETLEDYCRAVQRFTEQSLFFTVRSIVAEGFSHPLDELGFDEYFYAAVLTEDRERFSYQRMGGTRVFVNGRKSDIFKDMLFWLVGTAGRMDIYELRDLLEDRYGIALDKDKLIAVIRETDMYYDVIMQAVYIDYDTYFEEV